MPMVDTRFQIVSDGGLEMFGNKKLRICKYTFL